MKQFVERMIREKKDLNSKIKKAKIAIENRPFDMDDKGFALLVKQVEIMESYVKILEKRIKHSE